MFHEKRGGDMTEKSIPERVLDEFINSFEGNKVFSDDDLKTLQKILQKDEQVTKKDILNFIKMEVKE